MWPNSLVLMFPWWRHRKAKLGPEGQEWGGRSRTSQEGLGTEGQVGGTQRDAWEESRGTSRRALTGSQSLSTRCPAGHEHAAGATVLTRVPGSYSGVLPKAPAGPSRPDPLHPGAQPTERGHAQPPEVRIWASPTRSQCQGSVHLTGLGPKGGEPPTAPQDPARDSQGACWPSSPGMVLKESYEVKIGVRSSVGETEAQNVSTATPSRICTRIVALRDATSLGRCPGWEFGG